MPKLQLKSEGLSSIKYLTPTGFKNFDGTSNEVEVALLTN